FILPSTSPSSSSPLSLHDALPIYQVSRLVLWKMRDRCLNSLSRERPRLTDTQPANGVPREPNLNGSFCRFSSYLGMIHSSLHDRSEEHTSELQSRGHLVCRLLLEK